MRTPDAGRPHAAAREGGDSHCEPAGNALRGERIFNWLDQHIPA